MAVPNEPRDRLVRPVIVRNRRSTGINVKGFCAGFLTSVIFCAGIFLFFYWYNNNTHIKDVDRSQSSGAASVPVNSTHTPVPATTKSRFQEIDIRGIQGLTDPDKKSEKHKEESPEDVRFLSRPSRHLKSLPSETYPCQKRIVASFDLQDSNKKEPTDKQLSLLTHIIFYPMQVHSNGTISVNEDLREKFERLVKKAKQFNVKVMFSTVELKKENMKMEEIIVDEGKRKNLLDSILNIIQSNDLDGVDIHWRWAYSEEHYKNLILLCKQLREQLGEQSIISIATGLLVKDTKVQDVSGYVDFFNIEASPYYGYGYGGFGEASGPSQPFSDEENMVEKALKYYSCLTKTPEKLNFVVRFHETRSSFNETEDREKMSKDGFSSKEFLKHLEKKAWSVETAKRDLEDKLEYVMDKNIGGLTIWRVQNDNADGTLMEVVMEKKCIRGEKNFPLPMDDQVETVEPLLIRRPVISKQEKTYYPFRGLFYFLLNLLFLSAVSVFLVTYLKDHEKRSQQVIDIGIKFSDEPTTEDPSIVTLLNGEEDPENSKVLSRQYRHLKPLQSDNSTFSSQEAIDTSGNSTLSRHRVVACYDLYDEKEPTDEQLSMLTHIIFYPMGIYSNGTITLREYTKEKFERLVKKAKQFNVKVMISTVLLSEEDIIQTDSDLYNAKVKKMLAAILGKEEETPDLRGMPGIMMDDERRRTFRNSIIEVVQLYDLDGVDVRWRWSRSSDHETKLILLCKELRENLTDIFIFSNRTDPFIISVSTGLTIHESKINEVSELVDFFNVEADYHYSYVRRDFGEARGLGLSHEFYVAKILPGFAEPPECETARKLKEKLDYLKDKNIGGVTIWRIGNDDKEHNLLKMIKGAELSREEEKDILLNECN
ncbi:unnamed protein product [Caenorhabditis brenneri]